MLDHPYLEKCCHNPHTYLSISNRMGNAFCQCGLCPDRQARENIKRDSGVNKNQNDHRRGRPLDLTEQPDMACSLLLYTFLLFLRRPDKRVRETAFNTSLHF